LEKKKYEAGLKTAMTDEKLQHLAGMDFQWSVQKENWDQRLEELKTYKDKYGHCRVPQKGQLRNWVREQRTSRGNASRSRERTASLDEIGFFD
jgi:hypothetical protein